MASHCMDQLPYKYNSCMKIYTLICLYIFFAYLCEQNMIPGSISSVESQKGTITNKRCSIENQKGAIAIYRLCTAIAPFWFSMKHIWRLIVPFWLSTDDIFHRCGSWVYSCKNYVCMSIFHLHVHVWTQYKLLTKSNCFTNKGLEYSYKKYVTFSLNFKVTPENFWGNETCDSRLSGMAFRIEEVYQHPPSSLTAEFHLALTLLPPGE